MYIYNWAWHPAVSVAPQSPEGGEARGELPREGRGVNPNAPALAIFPWYRCIAHIDDRFTTCGRSLSNISRLLGGPLGSMQISLPGASQPQTNPLGPDVRATSHAFFIRSVAFGP